MKIAVPTKTESTQNSKIKVLILNQATKNRVKAKMRQ